MNAGNFHDYSSIIDAMPGLSILVDQSGLIAHINKKTLCLSGCQESEIIGVSMESLPFSSSYVVDSKSGLLHTEWTSSDGNAIDLDWTPTPFVLDGKKFTLFTTYHNKNLEPDLASMSCGFCAIDKEARIIFANNIISQLTGYDNDELVGMEISTFLQVFNEQDWDCLWTQSDENIVEITHKITTKSGQRRALRLRYKKADWHGTQAIHCLAMDCTTEYENELEEHEKLETIKLVSDITFKLATGRYNKDLLSEQLGRLGTQLGLDRVSLVSLPNMDGSYNTISMWASDQQYKLKLPYKIPKTLFEEIRNSIENNRYLLKHVNNKNLHVSNGQAATNVKTILLIPVKAQRSLWGALSLASCKQDRNWKEWEIKLCESFGASLSAIFDNLNKLRESLQRYETLAETVQNGILALQGENVVYFNRACTEITGYGSEELLKRPFFDFFHPDSRQEAIDNYQKRQTQEDITPLETVKIITKGGKEKIVKYWITRDKLDGQDSFIVSFSDVTDLVIAKEKALQSNAMIETIVSTVHDVIYIKDLQGRFIYFRWPKEEQAGMKFDNYIGHTLSELTPELQDIEIVEKYRQQVIDTGKPVKFTRSMLLAKWGQSTEYEIQVFPFFDNQGKMIGTIGIAHNITEEIIAKRKLEQLENRLTKISETISDIIFQLDDEKIIYVSPAIRTYGFEPEELVGKSITSLFSFDIQTSFEEDGQKSFETHFKNKCGLECDMEVKLTIDGSNIIGMARDISERKNHEKAKKNFLKSVAHELRNPLTLVLGYSELLMSSTVNNKNLHDMASIIYDAAESEKKRLNEFFDLDRTVIDYNFETINTWKLLNNIYTKLWMLVPKIAKQKHGTNKTSFGFFVHPELKEKRISVDTNRFSEIIENLASNAVKYSPPNRIALFLSAKSENGRLIIKISDKGIGIEKKNIPYIFKPFYQINPPGYENDGLGLGLANVKMHVQAHNGTIEVESRLSEGTDFILSFPLCQ